MTTKPSSTAPGRPTVDEWGLYDPQQAGLAALFTRLGTVPAAPSGPVQADGVEVRILTPATPARGSFNA